ncbi:Hint domain-containing protein [Acidisphaera rubrifaciens]|uniref:Hedgehog/Intein (Hint) domain-containing protein n=1 Tax=Acidisphaera rubrifaciens HS-AP3 TaxID=1231350 RepID=A0A0D6P946_9PROT|nr:Hint domain-containing protein [Acidisphaera rubrifaciens]GAN78177.1 hypothetical protein Asru_0672_05 [Acidisphaera rubrifaciens HS-AP3]
MTINNYSTIYAFGDSLSDAGDVYLLTSSPLASPLGLSPEPVSPPYYQETYGTVKADIFSNGPNWVQNLSTDLGFGVLAPGTVGGTVSQLTTIAIAGLEAQGYPPATATLVATAAIDSLAKQQGVSGPNGYLTLASGATGGTDFAIGGAVTGVTNENSSFAVPLTDLSAQLTNFKNAVPTPAANALSTVWIGSNDILDLLEDPNFGTYFPNGTTLGTVGSTKAGIDMQQSVANEIGFIGSLVADGVTNLLVLDVPDLSQVPAITKGYPSETGAALVLSEYYNQLLNTDLGTVTGAKITIENTFSLIDNAIANPGSYGLKNVTDSVYTGSLTNFTPSDLVSSDPTVQNTYLFFDKQHPTETGQTAVANQALADLTCFVTGTRIATARGAVAVEALRAGDMIVLADGGTLPVRWVGRRQLACASHPDPHSVWPVRIAAGAFGAAGPAHDLYLSPDHAVFIDGALIPAKHLVDGDAVARVACDTVTYWHVELPRHAVLLAEGLACESFLDTRQRRGDYVTRVWEAEGCAELVVTGPRLAAARARLSGARAA